jgi:hypothetical protein
VQKSAEVTEEEWFIVSDAFGLTRGAQRNHSAVGSSPC